MTRLARRGDFEGTQLDLIFAERAVDVWLTLDRIDDASITRQLGLTED